MESSLPPSPPTSRSPSSTPSYFSHSYQMEKESQFETQIHSQSNPHSDHHHHHHHHHPPHGHHPHSPLAPPHSSPSLSSPSSPRPVQSVIMGHQSKDEEKHSHSHSHHHPHSIPHESESPSLPSPQYYHHPIGISSYGTYGPNEKGEDEEDDNDANQRQRTTSPFPPPTPLPPPPRHSTFRKCDIILFIFVIILLCGIVFLLVAILTQVDHPHHGFPPSENHQDDNTKNSSTLHPPYPYRSPSSPSYNSSSPTFPFPFSPLYSLFCNSSKGSPLSVFQLSSLFNDSKSYVDYPLRRDPQKVIDAFYSLSDYSDDKLSLFLRDNFHVAGSDIDVWIPTDWTPSPPLIPLISDPNVKSFAIGIHSLWNLLGRSISPSVYSHPTRHTLLPLRHPHMIVPGGRFREIYYWDNYWIQMGLLASNMRETVNSNLENLLFLIDSYGFIPNGGRYYYLSRSQPPFVSLMVDNLLEWGKENIINEMMMETRGRGKEMEREGKGDGDGKRMGNDLRDYYHHDNATSPPPPPSSPSLPFVGNLSLIEFSFPFLEREYSYWMKEGEHAIRMNLKNSNGNFSFLLNRFWSPSQIPRPESFREDMWTASLLPPSEETKEEQQEEQIRNSSLSSSTSSSPSSNFSHFQVRSLPHRQSELFSHLTASAESGWDFSSRWFSDRKNLSTSNTEFIIPVDLNSLLYGVEMVLAKFSKLLGDGEKESFYIFQAEERMTGMKHFLWSERENQWEDFNWKEMKRDGGAGFVSNYFPIHFVAKYSKWMDNIKHHEREKDKDKDTSSSSSVDSFHLIHPHPHFLSILPNISKQFDSFYLSGLPLPGGIVTSLDDDGQQWDWPNAWSPLQDILSESFLHVGYNYLPINKNLKKGLNHFGSLLPLGISDPQRKGQMDYGSISCYLFTSRWLYSLYLSFIRSGVLFEKYFAPQLGVGGSGGEYPLQAGFGWTNGEALKWIEKYKTFLNFTEIKNYPTPEQIIDGWEGNFNDNDYERERHGSEKEKGKGRGEGRSNSNRR